MYYVLFDYCFFPHFIYTMYVGATLSLIMGEVNVVEGGVVEVCVGHSHTLNDDVIVTLTLEGGTGVLYIEL